MQPISYTGFSRFTIATVAAAGLVSCAGVAAHAQTLDLGDLQAVASTGLASALFLTNAPGDAVTRLYVLEQAGRVRRIDGTTLQAASVLDITTIVLAAGTNPEFNRQGDSEQGLLGMAFHPNYQTNRFFYVYYIEPRGSTFVSNGLTYDNGRSVVARYTMNAAGTATVAGSATIVLKFDQSQTNHNGGCMYFGTDEFLYIGTGDGGGGGDQPNNALNPNLLLGKMLRIDVNGDDFPADVNANYRIPADNPTTWPTGAGGTQTGRRENWAIGLRNPWRWSFDKLTGDMWIADVGQDRWEEVNIVAGNGGPGRNYGWRRWEGLASFNTNIGTFSVANSVLPVYVYPRNATAGFLPTQQGQSTTGGFVYRGTAIPGWRGRYFFGDFVAGRIWSFRLINGVQTDFQDHTTHLTAGATGPSSLASFGEDNDGELYTVHFAAPRVRKIVPSALSNSLSVADVAQGGGLPGPDGTIDGDDFIAFINAFAAGDLLADVVNGGGTRPPDGIVDGSDFIAFINAFAAG